MSAAAYWSPLLAQSDLKSTDRIAERENLKPNNDTCRNTKPSAIVDLPPVPPTLSHKKSTVLSGVAVPAPANPHSVVNLSLVDISAIKKEALVDLIGDESPCSVLQIAVAATSSSFSLDHKYHCEDAWRSPRWRELKAKRLALGQKRVQLEQRILATRARSFTKESSISLPPARHCRLNSGIIVEWSGALDVDSDLPTGFGKVVYRDGQIYEGFVVNGLRHGVGKNTWSRGRRDSSSSATTTTGQVYQGEWHLDHRHGRGTHTWPDGKTATGQWQHGQLHGRVYFGWSDGSTYDGEVVQGRKHGRGTHTQQDGSVYQGEFVAGYQEGIGTLLTAHGQQYRGNFQWGQRHGFGVQIWTTKTYEGEWVHNVMQGRGKLVWRDTGAVYEGDFYQGQLHGLGLYRNGQRMYAGQWCHGAREGRGAQHWADGPVYDGSFHKNKRHGFGRMVYLDDSLYIGGWQGGHRSGFGIEISGNRSIRHCGMWERNTPQMPGSGARKSSDDSNISVQFHSPTHGLIRSRSFDERDLDFAW